MNYIQIKTGIQHAAVRSINGKEKVIYMAADEAIKTTYIDAARAKMLAFALLKAAAHAEKAR